MTPGKTPGMAPGMALSAAIFASGRGSNFEALTGHARSTPEASGWRVGLLLTDRDDAPVLDRARSLGVASAVVPVKDRTPREVARDTLDELERVGADLVLLAGYLRLVPAQVVRAFRGRMLNVHPALLPSFGGEGMYGARVHEAVLAAGVRITGPTVHFVDEEYDRGPILAQWPVPVRPGDTVSTLAGRVQAVEHRLYPAAVDSLVHALRTGREPEPIPGPGDAETFLLEARPGRGRGLAEPMSDQAPDSPDQPPDSRPHSP